MSFITKLALKYLLKDAKNYDEISDICSKHSSMCISEKQLMCKKILQVSGYKVPRDTNSCSIYDELLERTKELDRPYNINRFYVDQALINAVDMFGSKSLKEFFIKNGHNVTIRRSLNNIQNTNVISNHTKITDTFLMRR